jgi:hypothetical protein
MSKACRVWKIKGPVISMLFIATPRRRVGEWRHRSTHLNHATTWRWLGTFMFRPLYFWGKSLLYPLDRRQVSPRAGLNAVEKRKKTLPLLGTERRFLGSPACTIVPLLAELFRLLCIMNFEINNYKLNSCVWNLLRCFCVTRWCCLKVRELLNRCHLSSLLQDVCSCCSYCLGWLE